jgi:DNA polymerase-3 subunit gamma/tau
MSYTVLARKYRPQTFSDLVGQEHVTRTLANAIASGRVAHAFLFTGVRGVGKTTSARVLAKALNCEQGPTAEPCNVCDACKQITQGVDLDVIEMDGASNNSVEDVRRLQESIPFRPARDRFKVVIVDEVHMLSTGAFNAFLKTLEEPPAHVKFIFATTEAHKVPVTIRSRCQRYDFRLIPQSVIAQRVSEILGKEGLEADAQAVTLVAREAAGSMRDALTLLDQVLAFSGDKLLGARVAEELGIADREHVHALHEAVLAGDGKRALEVIDGLATQGLDLLHFAKQWLDLARDVVVLKVAGDQPKLVDLPPEDRTRALASAAGVDTLELERAFSAISQLVEEVGKASAPKTALEMGAVRLATRPPLRDLAQLIARLEELEKGGNAAPPAATPRGQGPSGPGGGGRPGPDAPAGGPRGPAPQQRSEGAPSPGVSPPSNAPSSPVDPKANPFARFIPTSEGVSGPEARETSVVAPMRPSTPVGLATAVSTLSSVSPTGAAPALSVARPAAVPTPVPNATAPMSRAAANLQSATDPSHARERARFDPQLWPRIIQHLRENEPRWAAMYEHGVPSALSPQQVVVVFPEGSFFGRQAQTHDGSEAMRRAARAVLGADPELTIRTAIELPGVTLAQQEAALLDERKEAVKKKALGHPRVQEAFKVFPELAQKHDVEVE